MIKQLETMLKPEEDYNCKIISTHGHERFSGRGIYLGKVFGVKNQLHGFIWREQKDSGINAIKFADSKKKLDGEVLVVEGFIQVYSMSNKEREYWEGLLKRRGL